MHPRYSEKFALILQKRKGLQMLDLSFTPSPEGKFRVSGLPASFLCFSRKLTREGGMQSKKIACPWKSSIRSEFRIKMSEKQNKVGTLLDLRRTWEGIFLL